MPQQWQRVENAHALGRRRVSLEPEGPAPEHIEAAPDPAAKLAEIEERSVPEIAEALAIPLNTAYSRLRVAREEFKQAATRLRSRGGRA